MGAERWHDNWLVVSPPDPVRAAVPRSPWKRRRLGRTLRELPAETPVVLFAAAPGAIGRCRSVASEAGVRLDSEYLAFPSANAPAYLVEDAPAPVRLFVKNVLATPPGFAFAAVLDVVLALLRVSSPWRVIRRVAPGRVAVGSRA